MSKKMAAEAEAEGDHGALGQVHEYMGDMYLDAGDAASARQHYNAALEHRIQADTNDETKANQERAHIYKMAIAAMIDKDMEKAANLTAEYTAAAEARGTAFEKRRSHALKGYLAMMNDDMAGGAEHLAKANQFNPAVLYWQGVAHAELGNTDKARQLLTRAASRNTLHGQFAMMHDDAAEMLTKLSS
jgi:tetratricopeptide (TPR) repeat protein